MNRQKIFLALGITFAVIGAWFAYTTIPKLLELNNMLMEMSK